MRAARAERAWAVTLPFQGPTLAELIARRGALDAPEVVRAVTPVCEAMGRLLAAGRVQRAAELVLVDETGRGTRGLLSGPCRPTRARRSGRWAR